MEDEQFRTLRDDRNGICVSSFALRTVCLKLRGHASPRSRGNSFNT